MFALFFLPSVTGNRYWPLSSGKGTVWNSVYLIFLLICLRDFNKGRSIIRNYSLATHIRSLFLCFYCKQHSSAIFCLEKFVFKYRVYINFKIIFYQCLLTAKHFIADFKSIRVDVNWVMFLAFELIIPLVVILLSIWLFLAILKFWCDKCYDWHVLIDSWYPSHLQIKCGGYRHMSQAINM